MKLTLRSLIASITLLLATVAAASANCPESMISLEAAQPLMARHWQRLQQQTTYPWGTVRPYASLSGDRMTLTAEFDRLSAPQKQQVIDTALFYPATPEERAAAGGLMAPFGIYASDGRAVSMPYDGCTRFTMLTEKARYSWYYLTQNRDFSNDPILLEQLRNVGRPAWRSIQFPIAAVPERQVRLSFWNAIGYSQAETGWWIAWVPEQGYFEINVPNPYNTNLLQDFLQTAPHQYRYVVVASDGTELSRTPQE